MGNKKKNFYAVLNDDVMAIFNSWEECKNHVIGIKGIKFKGFEFCRDARKWLEDQHNARKNPKTIVDPDYIVYTDGSCFGNPGPGGYAVIVMDNNNCCRYTSGSREDLTTSAKMEMNAVLAALNIVSQSSKIILNTDSKYVKDAFTESWISNWKENGWHTSSGREIKNKDLWIQLSDLVENKKLDIEWRWVKAHDNDPINNECDVMAKHQALNVSNVDMIGEEKCNESL